MTSASYTTIIKEKSAEEKLDDAVTGFKQIGWCIVLTPPLCFLWAWTYQHYWAWFAVPYFHVAPLSLRAAVALYALVGLVRVPVQYKKSDPDESFTVKCWVQILAPVVALGTGWLIQWAALTFLH